MPKMLHSNEYSRNSISKPLYEDDVLLARIARLIHRELLAELQRNKIYNIKPGSTALVAVGNQLLFATENNIANNIIQKMKKSLVAKLNTTAEQDENDLFDLIDEKREKMSAWIQKFTHENIAEEYKKKWRNKKRSDGEFCTKDDVCKHFERTIIGIQADIDQAVLALCFIENDKWVLNLLNQNTMHYVSNGNTSYHQHPEITLVAYIDKYYKDFKGKLPVLTSNEQEIPYLFVANGIKSCQKCHTLLSGNNESNFEGFNGTYLTRKSSDFVVFVYDHYNSGYPGYWIPPSFQSILLKSESQLQSILNNSSIPSRQRERDDRIEFFLDRIIQEEQVKDELELTDELQIIEISPVEQTLLTTPPVVEESSNNNSEAEVQNIQPAIRSFKESSASFWSKLGAAKQVDDIQLVSSQRPFLGKG